jgi:hypothetical protein
MVGTTSDQPDADSTPSDSDKSKTNAPYERVVSGVVAKIKHEPLLFILGISALLIGLGVLPSGLGSDTLRLLIMVIAALAFVAILGFYFSAFIRPPIGPGTKDSKKIKPQAAAVCYSVADGTVKLLLVKTSGGGRWTFPKGEIQEKEEKWQAAEREAEEEAGALGEIEHKPFTSYLFQSQDWVSR